MVRKSVTSAILGTLVVGWMLHDAQAEIQEREVIHTRIYYIADLPVWRADRKSASEFDAKILIAYIKTAVTPVSWSGDVEIRPFNSNASLVISHTVAGHEKIADLLTELRPARFGETTERVGKTASEKNSEP